MKIAMYDTKPYDKEWFDKLKPDDYEFFYFETKLKEKMDAVKKYIQEQIAIVHELEGDFPGRQFTLDGHLVGSIGEVMAAYYYGIELYRGI